MFHFSSAEVRTSLLFLILFCSFATASFSQGEETEARTIFAMCSFDGSDDTLSEEFFKVDAERVQSLTAAHMGLGLDRKKTCFYNSDAIDDLRDSQTSEISWNGPSVMELGNYDVFGNIIQGLKNLQGKVKKNDVVLFYWSGHGTYYANDGHYLQTCKGGRELKRAVVIETIKRYANPRLVVIITDSCAGVGGYRVESPPVELAPPRPPRRKSSPIFDELFFNYSGIVDINGTEVGLRGYSGFYYDADDPYEQITGFGIFTEALCGFLDRYEAQRPNWSQLVAEVDRITQATFLKLKRDGVFTTSQMEQRIGAWSVPNNGGTNEGGAFARDDETNPDGEFLGLLADSRSVEPDVDKLKNNDNSKDGDSKDVDPKNDDGSKDADSKDDALPSDKQA